MTDLVTDISVFHEKFNLTYDGPPRLLDPETVEFRIKFMQEELNEYCEGVSEGNLSKQLDALVDLVYVALGTSYLQGFPFALAWDAVHRANLRKERAGPNGEGSKRGSPLDVIKPEGWQPPDIEAVLMYYSRRWWNLPQDAD